MREPGKAEAGGIDIGAGKAEADDVNAGDDEKKASTGVMDTGVEGVQGKSKHSRHQSIRMVHLRVPEKDLAERSAYTLPLLPAG